jgi:hypothetical protein
LPNPHNFKYGELLRTSGVWRGAALNPRSRCLNQIAVAFTENIFRTDSFVSFPAELVVRVKTGRSSNYDRIRVGVKFIDDLLDNGNIGVRQSIEALLSSTVIESWTTFESLALDLWIAAVDGGPPEFAQKVNAAVPERGDQPLDKFKFDPRKDYAASLVEVGKVSFRRLDKIVHWYTTAFGNGSRKLFKEVEGGYIYALSAYRNALVHNAGKTDKDFISRISAVDNLRGKFREDQKLELDGELVRQLRGAGIVLGQRLICFIDDLITPPAAPA